MTDKIKPGEMELVTARPQVPANVNATDPESIVRFAVEHHADPATMASVMAVRRELRAEAAKEAFDRSLAAFQAECPAILKRKVVRNKGGDSIRYKYAPLDDIVAQVKALLQNRGFSFTMNSAVDKTYVRAICKITHSAGHSELSQFEVPIDPDAFMNQQQKFASALTFAKRYAFCNAFGILTADEDTDGRMEQEKPKGPSSVDAEPQVRALAKELWDLLKPVRGAKPDWNEANQWLWKNDILDGGIPEQAPHLPVARLKHAIAKAKELLK